MFPYAPPANIDEVAGFMADLGATETWTNSIYPYTEYHPDLIAWMQFGDPRIIVRTPADAIATWRMRDTGDDESILKNWEASLINTIPTLKLWSYDLPAEHKVFLLLDKVADYLAIAGYERQDTAAAVGLYVYADRKRRQTFAETTLADLLTCAEIAHLDHVSFEDRIDIIWRGLPIGEIKALLQKGTPYSLIKDLFVTA